MMNTKSARRTLADSTLALIAACAGIAMFLPPMLSSTVASVPRTVAVALVIALALPLHWILLGIAAKRMGRSVGTWVGVAVLLFPGGGAAALILVNWLLDEEPQGLPAALH